MGNDKENFTQEVLEKMDKDEKVTKNELYIFSSERFFTFT